MTYIIDLIAKESIVTLICNIWHALVPLITGHEQVLKLMALNEVEIYFAEKALFMPWLKKANNVTGFVSLQVLKLKSGQKNENFTDNR